MLLKTHFTQVKYNYDYNNNDKKYMLNSIDLYGFVKKKNHINKKIIVFFFKNHTITINCTNYIINLCPHYDVFEK